MILISPSYNRQHKLGGFSRYVPISVPTGIGYLAGSLMGQGKKVKIIDESVIPDGQIMDIIDSFSKELSSPYIFGISCLTAGIARGHELAGLIKSRYPDSKVLFGNMHPTVMAEDVLRDTNVDIVVRGEADETLNILYDKLKNNEDFSSMKGLSFRRGGKAVHNPSAELPDMSRVARFPYHLFDPYAHRYEMGFVISSRGCPYNCIFCSQRIISGTKYRYVSSEIVIQDIEIIVNKYKRPSITFLDDSLLVNKARIMELCELIQQKGFHKKVIFDCQARGDTVDEKILTALKKAGFRSMHFGIETASERLMKLIDKRETVREITEGIRLAKRIGFQVSGTFILGLPTETRAERNAAYSLAKDLSLDYVRFNNATPYPGTKLYEIALKEGRFNPGPGWENLNACGTFVESPLKSNPLAYVPLGVSEKELRYDILKFSLFYSFRPKSIYKILKDRVGPSGWLTLPERWYFSFKEWGYLIRFAFRIAGSLAKVYLYNIANIFRRD